MSRTQVQIKVLLIVALLAGLLATAAMRQPSVMRNCDDDSVFVHITRFLPGGGDDIDPCW